MKLVNKIKDRLAYEYYVRLAYKKSWKTNRKIVVIESDDWGSIRMPNKKTYQSLKSFGINADQCNYMKYDALESNEDLECLFEVLSSFKDQKGNSPVFTTNMIVGNPDFEKIKASNYEEYFYEPFTETYKKYYNQDLKLWNEGIANKLVNPQLHGREHVNVLKWLHLLRNSSEELLFAFENGFWGVKDKISKEKNGSLMGAFESLNFNDAKKIHSKTIIDGSNLFESIFGYKPKSFIAPNYIWYDGIEKTLFEVGVEFIQGGRFQYKPTVNDKNEKVFHYTGQTNKHRQIFITRNCIFEPSRNYKDWVDLCLSHINMAFKNKNPAIIDTHRVNYMGEINKKNREENLYFLKTLLKKLIIKFPDVEFLTTQELGAIIKENN